MGPFVLSPLRGCSFASNVTHGWRRGLHSVAPPGLCLHQIPRPAYRPLYDAVAKRPLAPSAQADAFGVLYVVVEQVDHVAAELLRADDRRQLAVVFDTAVFEVGRADDADAAVGHHRFGVQDDDLPLVD